MNKYMDEARAIRASISGLSEGQTDERLLDNKAAFPFWNGNSVSYKMGDIVQYNDSLYRIIQSHISQVDWAPDAVPALFNRISLETWPDWVQPTGAHDAYSKNAKCKHNGKKWVSNIDANIWEPGVYGWTEAG